MKLSKLLALACLFAGSAGAATVNIQISQGSNQATNFANAAGNVSNGLVWGLMISTGNNTFSTFAAGYQLSTSLNGTLLPDTDDYFISSAVLTAQGTTTDLANPGKINILNGIQMAVPATNAIVTGNQFAIVWFDSTVTSATQTLTGGTSYGLLTNAAWTIPAGGATQNISASFTGSPDPVKLADDFVVTGVPEPTTALLGLLGVAGLIRRRR